jgi:two-component system response regulator TctD
MPIHIVEDDAALARGLTAVLRRKGFDAVSDEDAPSAIERLRSEPVRVVLLDLMLPNGSGFDVITYLRDRHVGPRPAVIVMTAANAEALGKIDRSVVKTVLFKPMELTQLADYVAVTRSAVP